MLKSSNSDLKELPNLNFGEAQTVYCSVSGLAGIMYLKKQIRCNFTDSFAWLFLYYHIEKLRKLISFSAHVSTCQDFIFYYTFFIRTSKF